MKRFVFLAVLLLGILLLSECNDKSEVAPQSTIFRTYPNPASSYIGIHIVNPQSEHFELKVFDTKGKIIFEKEGTDQSPDYMVSVSGMENGTYQAVLKKGGSTTVNKLLKI